VFITSCDFKHISVECNTNHTDFKYYYYLQKFDVYSFTLGEMYELDLSNKLFKATIKHEI